MKWCFIVTNMTYEVLFWFCMVRKSNITMRTLFKISTILTYPCTSISTPTIKEQSFFHSAFVFCITSIISWEIYGAYRCVVASGMIVILEFIYLPKLIFNKSNKSFYIFMIMINRSIPKESYFIKISNTPEYITTNSFWSNSLFILRPFIFKCIDSIFKFFWIIISFCKGFQHRIHNFCSIVRFTFSRRFCYHKWNEFKSLKCSKSCTTLLTFSTTTNSFSILSSTRIDNLCIEIFTLWAFHKKKER